MGLTLHWSLSLDAASIAEARSKILELHQIALKLPFQEVSEFAELVGEEACKFNQDNTDDDPHLFLKLGSFKFVSMEIGGIDTVYPIDAKYLMGFTVFPGEGAESANFGLAIHENISELNNWYWSGFCKTQYASNPDCGGINNFLKCHLTLTQLLDEAQKLGIVKSISDEGNYWESRNIQQLVEQINSYNILVAGVTGTLRDIPGVENTISPIYEYPNFEYLEAEGTQTLDQRYF